MFDIQKAIKNSHLSKREVLRLQAETKKEFPDDPMLCELHVIRALRLRVGKSKGLNKSRRFSLAGALFFVLVTSNCFAETVGLTSKEALLKAFQEALNAKNEEALVNLFYWEGVKEEEKSSYQKEMINPLLSGSGDIKGFEFKPDSNAWRRKYQQKGIRSRDNLSVLGVIEIQFAPNFSISLPYGKKENSLYFTQAIKEKMNGTQVFYSILIGGNAVSSSSDNFEGYCICLEDGQETKMEFRGNGMGSQRVWAEGIKYCELRKISGEFPISLQILEGESEPKKELFKSELVSSRQPIIYKAKKNN